MLFQNFLMLSIFCAMFVSVQSGGGGGGGDDENKIEIKHDVPYRVHTVHHHHIQKYTVVKKIEVPVIKEVKVPYKVYVFQKVPYKYYVKPLIVKVPVEYYHTKTEEHEHDKHEDEGHGGGSSGEEGGHGGDGGHDQGGNGGGGHDEGGYGGGQDETHEDHHYHHHD